MRWSGILLIAATFLVAAGFPHAAQAQPSEQISLSSQGGASLKGGKLYWVNYKCKLLTRNLAGNRTLMDLLAGILPVGQTTETFGFFLFKGGAPATSPDGDFAVKNNIAGAAHVYTRGSGSDNTFANTSCEGQFIVNGKDTPHIAVYLSTARQGETEFIAKTATFLSSVASPLFSLLNPGEVMDALDGEKVANISTTLSQYSEYLKIFDNTKSHAEVVPLRVGHLSFGTRVARVEMDIVPLDELLTPAGVNFRDGLAQIIASQPTVTTDELGDSTKLMNRCSTIAGEWLKTGLSTKLDQAYVLVHALLASSPSKEQIVQCLGRKRALAALPHLKLFRLVEEKWFNLDDINRIVGDPNWNEDYGAQPQGWPRLEATVKGLLRHMTRLKSGIVLASSDRAAFEGFFAPELEIRDETLAYDVRTALFPDSDDNTAFLPAPEAIAAFEGKQLTNWGCYLLTDANLEFKSLLNEAVVLLAWLPTGNGQGKPVSVRVLFNENREIAALIFSDDPDVVQPAELMEETGCSAASSVTVAEMPAVAEPAS